MKTGIFATILSFGILSAAFADDDSVKAHLANTLPVIFRTNNKNSLLNANAYYQKTIIYNGMAVVAFKSNTSNWVGFFKKLSSTDLPENARLNIARNFTGYKIQQVSMYISTEGDIDYFAELSGNNKSFILEIETDGSVKRFNGSHARKMS